MLPLVWREFFTKKTQTLEACWKPLELISSHEDRRETCELHIVFCSNVCNRCLSFLCVSVVCPGTQNGLSSTGSQEHQYNLIKDRYDGCEIIMGNLEITQIESNWDFSFLKVNTCRPHCTMAFISFSQNWSRSSYFPVVSCQWSSLCLLDNPWGDWLRPHCYELLSGGSFRATTDHQREQPLWETFCPLSPLQLP